MSKYYLIGMPGSGKSTASKQLSKRLNLDFFDLDQEIELKDGRKIAVIFQEDGEDYFRDLETSILKSYMDKQNCIISCGGGIVVRSINKEYMKNGIVIFLNPPLGDIKIRLQNDKTRPLLKVNSLDLLYKKRLSLYKEFSQIEIKETILSKVVSKIIKEVRIYEKKYLSH